MGSGSLAGAVFQERAARRLAGSGGFLVPSIGPTPGRYFFGKSSFCGLSQADLYLKFTVPNHYPKVPTDALSIGTGSMWSARQTRGNGQIPC